MEIKDVKNMRKISKNNNQYYLRVQKAAKSSKRQQNVIEFKYSKKQQKAAKSSKKQQKAAKGNKKAAKGSKRQQKAAKGSKM